MNDDAPDCTEIAVQALAKALRARGWRMACAESCTGGLVAAACTSQAGSSDWFDRGFVTYSNEAKSEMLGVDAALIDRHGAVSDAVVRAMAQGALSSSRAQATTAVSGVAGPGGGSVQKPVGLVWFAWACTTAAGVVVVSESCHFDGDRTQVRQAAMQHALRGLSRLISSQ